MKYQFVLTLWGKTYLDLFSSVVLPSLMTTGNLLGFSRYQSEFDIYTTPESKAILERMPILSALAGFMPIRISAIEGTNDASDEQKYLRMNRGHALATERSARIDSVLFFLAPDAVFADGTCAHARALVELGKRVVLLPGPRAAAAPFKSELRDCFNPNQAFGMQVSPRQLASLLLKHPHDCRDYTIWGNTPYTKLPSHIVFPVADEGYILRGFHQHPLAVFPRIRGELPKAGLDGRWLIDVVPDVRDWHLIIDSDDACVVDVGTAPGHHLGATAQSNPVEFVADWMTERTDAGHQWLVTQSVNFHRDERSLQWQAVEKRAAAVIDEIFDFKKRRNALMADQIAALTGTGSFVVWGAGAAAETMIAGHLEASQIAFFIDTDERKHGQTCLGRPIRPPETLLGETHCVVLISSAKYEHLIRRQIAEQFGMNVQRVMSFDDLLSGPSFTETSPRF